MSEFPTLFTNGPPDIAPTPIAILPSALAVTLLPNAMAYRCEAIELIPIAIELIPDAMLD